MSHTPNTKFVEDQQDDFDLFLSQKNWVSAQAIIDNLYETGFEHEAVVLRKSLLNTQRAHLDSIQAEIDAQVECPTCTEAPGTELMEVGDSYYSRVCRTCDGTGLVDPE